ncbi:MAG TPA: xanthine dehydrogenase family protein molybdopterin-binding subunit [Terriglobia bacterium]|nr:xanthine dehydrogenase family protein molybdopterin-binding subunit [Terriglobia bacterium]
MPKCKYDWPEAGERHLIGTRIQRIDGPMKSSGRAKYTYDTRPPGMLYGRMLTCPYAHAKITAIDTSEAEKLPGVKGVLIIRPVGTEIQWEGDEVVAVAAESETAADDALRAIKVEYDVLPHVVNEEDLSKVGDRAKAAAEQKTGDPDTAFKDPDAVISEGYYGAQVITHCCLETHGNTADWGADGKLKTWSSTQNVSGLPAQFAEGLKLQKVDIPATDIETVCNYIGGGFGSKFSPDNWGIVAAQLSKQTGKPVRLMLERDADQQVAGARPSYFGKVRVAAKKDGTLTGWNSETWGTGGMGPSGNPPVPYVLEKVPNQLKKHTRIDTNTGGARAWRAPNHPQAAVVTMCALDDLAAKLEMDPIEFLKKNCNLAAENLSKVYCEELDKAAELSEWKKNWHPRGDKTAGHLKRGLGVSIHTWGGRGHASTCLITILPDGSVEAKLGSQDLGTGTRTVIAVVVAETLGLQVKDVKVTIGDSAYPQSGGSGGSTTVGGVSASTRRGAVDARDQLFAAVAPALGVEATQLEAVNGRIQVAGTPSKGLAWKAACAKLGVKTIEAHGKNPGECKLGDSGVGGCEVADVTVDTETGIVKINRMVAAQDCGLIIDMKTAESQVLGALIMGIGYSLYEQRLMDDQTGIMLNPNMEFYKLAGIGDIGELVVHMMTGPGYDERGVIGLGEPPVISPGASISNAVANAIGVRVPTIPITPEKVLAALAKGGMA